MRDENGVWILEDSGSTNGTFRDSERITRISILTPLLIRLGNPEYGPLLRLDPVIPPLAAEVRPDASQPVPSVDRRYLRVIAADRFYLGTLVAIPLILGGVVRVMPSPDGLSAASRATAPPAGNRTHRK